MGEFESFHRDMAELTRRDALKVLLTGSVAAALAACGINVAVNGDNEGSEVPPTSLPPATETVKPVGTQTGPERQEAAINSFLESNPDYKDRDMFAINISFQGVPADSIVITPTEEEKLKINSYKYSYEGHEYQSYDNAIIYTQKTTPEGTEWVRLAGVWFPTEDGSIVTAWYYSPDAFKDGQSQIDYTKKVFGFNSKDNNFVFWPLIEPPVQIKWSSDLGSTNPDDYTEWNGIDPYTISLGNLNTDPGSSKVLFAPRPEEVIKEFTICTPEKFRDCVITEEELFDGTYLRWLQTQSKAFDPAKVKDVPFDIMTIPDGNPMIVFNKAGAPNFIDPESAPFRRDVTSGIVWVNVDGTNKYPCIVKPIEFFDKNNPGADGNKWVITVESYYGSKNPLTGEYVNIPDLDMWMDTNVKTWKNEMGITPIRMTSLTSMSNTVDPLTLRTFNSVQDLQGRFQRFISGEVGALSEPGIILNTSTMTITGGLLK